MGSPETESARALQEGPQHGVELQSFALAQTETTFDDYDRFARATRRKLPNDAGWGRGTSPVINVSWRDASDYAQWVSEQTGQRYRLPSEAEWEYAARAGTAAPFSTGGCISTDQANFDGNYAYSACPQSQRFLEKTRPTAAYPANAFKLHDVHGNVYEWVQDCYHSSYAAAPRDGHAWMEEDHGDCARRILRGGSWINFAPLLRSAFRNRDAMDAAYNHVGLRLARTL